MTAKLSDEAVSTIMSLFEQKVDTAGIAKAAGCAASTVVKYLNSAGIILGNKGSTKKVTEEYVSLTATMREQGFTWEEVEKKIGFHRKTLRRELRSFQAQQ